MGGPARRRGGVRARAAEGLTPPFAILPQVWPDRAVGAARGPDASTPTMPRRTDIHTILIIGSGPIVIGQGCEFDYSGTQACKALREEGYRVVLV
ncbi:MAG: hypothetical protein ACKOGJ_07930, partial [Phycisphaerales bacterium]